MAVGKKFRNKTTGEIAEWDPVMDGLFYIKGKENQPLVEKFLMESPEWEHVIDWDTKRFSLADVLSVVSMGRDSSPITPYQGNIILTDLDDGMNAGLVHPDSLERKKGEFALFRNKGV